MIDGENPPEKYGSGSYQVKNDTFYVTSEFSAQPSQLLGKTIAYTYKFETDTLTIKGTLPEIVIEKKKKVSFTRILSYQPFH